MKVKGNWSGIQMNQKHQALTRTFPFAVSLSAYIFCASIAAAPAAGAAEFKVDPAHSTVSFKIRHIFSKVQGTFNKFQGTLEYVDGNPEAWEVEASADVASIDTNEPDRDKHLRSKDFFYVEKYPTMTFSSTQVTDYDDDRAKLHGLLTIRGIQKEVIFDLEIHGVGNDPWGNTKAGFTATTRINRTDFGLNWNKVLETGNVLVGEEVEIVLEIEATKVEG